MAIIVTWKDNNTNWDNFICLQSKTTFIHIMFEIKQIHKYHNFVSVKFINYCASKRKILLIDDNYSITDSIKSEILLIIVLLGNFDVHRLKFLPLFYLRINDGSSSYLSVVGCWLMNHLVYLKLRQKLVLLQAEQNGQVWKKSSIWVKIVVIVLILSAFNKTYWFI